MAYNFIGKYIIVTGAGGNIGREISVSLAQGGAHVYALDCQEEGINKLANELPNVEPVHQDLQKWEETKSVIEKLQKVDGLVNCVGISFKPENAVDVSKEIFDKTLSVDLLAPINVMQEVGKKMISGGKGGSIVNISSQLSGFALFGMLPYSIAKAGLNMATKQFAVELGPQNIRVNAICPGMVNTELLRATQPPAVIEAGIAKIPIRRLCEIEDVVKYVLFLLSDDSKMVNGTISVLDGGHTCQVPT